MIHYSVLFLNNLFNQMIILFAHTIFILFFITLHLIIFVISPSFIASLKI